MIELMLPALVAALILVGLHAYLGVHIIARGVIFVDLALAQLAAAGATVAVFFGLSADSLGGYIFALAATILGAALFSVSRIRNRYITQEAIIGIVFVVASAVTILLTAQAPRGAEHVQELLTGTLLWVTWPQIWRAAGIYAVIALLHWFLRGRFLLISLEPQKAKEKGWAIRWWDFLFYVLFGVVVTVSVSIVGVLLVFSFLVIPAVIAFLFTHRPGALGAIAWPVGAMSVFLGLYASYRTDLPTGPMVVCAFALALILAFVGRRLMAARARFSGSA
jgi:zinc/manganese transport system permease protein